MAYAVLHAGQAVSEAALRAYLAGLVPGYMVPSSIVLLERLPLMPNGKLDRTALPEPAAAAERVITEPQTETEATLLGIIRTILKRQDIGITDDFFEAGGNSLSALRLAGVLSKDRAPERRPLATGPVSISDSEGNGGSCRGILERQRHADSPECGCIAADPYLHPWR